MKLLKAALVLSLLSVPAVQAQTCEQDAPPAFTCELVPGGSCVYAHVYVRLDNGTEALAYGAPCGSPSLPGEGGFNTIEEVTACGRFFYRNGAQSVDPFTYRTVTKFVIYGFSQAPEDGEKVLGPFPRR